MRRFRPPFSQAQTSVVLLLLVRDHCIAFRAMLISVFVDADPYIPNGYGAQWYVNQDNL